MLTKLKIYLISFGVIISFGTFAQVPDYTHYVNPFIGTGASGHTFPGATLPMGLVQLSPETGNGEWAYCAGYQYKDKVINGFSHTHLSGTGVADLGDILIQPFTGAINKSQFGSRFSHDNEKASPGFYSVLLTDYQVKAELTSTARTGRHRYTFLKQNAGHLLIDLQFGLVNNNSDLSKMVLSSDLKVIDRKTLEGYRITNGWGGKRHVYFVVRFQKPFKAWHWLNGIAPGTKRRLVLDFDSKAALQVNAGVALSTVSIANARQNFDMELGTWNFETVKAKAVKTWNSYLSAIAVEGNTKQKQIYYTALYHSLIAPNNIADVNGQYRGADNKVYKAQDNSYYSTLSLWDTYRALNPLYTILYPEKTSGFVRSMLAHDKVAGYLPVWSLWGHENHCMIANHAIPVIVDAYLKGVGGFDAEQAYQAIKKTSTINHKNSDWSTYMKYGYLPSDLIKVESVSTTLESAYDDWCVAQMAKALGKTSDYDYFMKRSLFYKNVYDKSTGLMRGRMANGDWVKPFDPFKISHAFSSGGDFTEGNAWKYSWHVQQDVPGLINLMGGKSAFVNKLDSLFNMESKVYGDGATLDVTGLIGQYVQGNEPSHHVAYLYSLAGKPAKTQEKIYTIINELYNNTPEGLSGNDDCGQMSAWYLFSAMGFYPVNPASGEYVIGAPQLKKVSLKVGHGKTFTINALNFSVQNKYIKGITLNGKPYVKMDISHKDLLKGGIMNFTMGNTPNTN